MSIPYKRYLGMALPYIDKGVQYAFEAEKKVQTFLGECINDKFAPETLEKMSAMKDLIIQSAPHAAIYFAVVKGMMPTVFTTTYIFCHVFTVIKPCLETFLDPNFAGSLSTAFDAERDAITENMKKERDEVVKPAITVFLVAQAALSLLTFSIASSTCYFTLAYFINGQVISKIIQQTSAKSPSKTT